MSALVWAANSPLPGYISSDGGGRVFRVRRRENTRRYWVAIYPDGTSTDWHTTLVAAKLACERWEEDNTLLPLVDELTITIDNGAAAETSKPVVQQPAAEEMLPFRSVFEAHLTDTPEPYNSSVRRRALKNVAVLAQMRATVEQLLRDQIAVARTGVHNQWGGYRWGDEPITWQEIGNALGVSKQAAATRYGDKKA